MALVRAHWGLGLRALAGPFVTDPSPGDLRSGFARFQLSQRLGRGGRPAPGGLLRHRRPGAAPVDQGADRGAPPGGGPGHPVRAGTRGRRAHPRGDADPAAGFDALLLPRRLACRCLEAVTGFLDEPADAAPPLTGLELQAAGLVAAGLTNQAIARRLAIAPRTAEAHVENIRAQAAGALPGADRGMGDRAPTAPVTPLVVRPMRHRGGAPRPGGTADPAVDHPMAALGGPAPARCMASEAPPAATPVLSIPVPLPRPLGERKRRLRLRLRGRLRRRPGDGHATPAAPPDTALAVERDGDGSVRVRVGATLIAQAQPAPDAPDLDFRPRSRRHRPARRPGEPGTSRTRFSPAASSAGPPASPATGCGSSPARWPTGSCGRHRGRRTPRWPTPTAGRGPRSSGPRSTALAGSPPPTPFACTPPPARPDDGSARRGPRSASRAG